MWKKTKGGNLISSILGFLFTLLYVFLFYLFSIGIAFGCYSISSDYLEGDIYNGQIISYRSYNVQQRGSDNRSYDVIYYAPMFEFTANNKNLKVESLTHHTEKPIIGSNLNISYLDVWSGI
jgi:hypothetical protein